MIFQTLDKPNRSKQLFSIIFLETLDKENRPGELLNMIFFQTFQTFPRSVGDPHSVSFLSAACLFQND